MGAFLGIDFEPIQKAGISFCRKHMNLKGSSQFFISLVKYKRQIILLTQLGLVTLSYYIAFLLRFDFHLVKPYAKVFLETVPAVLLIKLVAFYWADLFRGWW